MDFVKPKILISSCLNACKCRYDGERINDDFINLLASHVHFINVCPEVAIGLGIPRESLRLVKQEDHIRLLQNKTERDYTKEMESFSNTYVNQLEEVQGFILKSKSPSCGVKDAKLYPKLGKAQSLGKTSGLFAHTLLEQYESYPIIDDGRLNDYAIREHFLERIYLLAAFDDMKKQESLKELQAFHHHNKMLLMSYSQKGTTELGRIIANSSNKEILMTLEIYRKKLIDVTTRLATVKTKINTFLHTFGQLSDHLNQKEIRFVLETLEQYQKGQIPFSSLVLLLKGYAIKHDEEKVLNQSFFNPYPSELLFVRDSGKQII